MLAIGARRSDNRKQTESQEDDMIKTRNLAAGAALPLLAALALGACAKEEPTYEADVTDESGGEMVVSDVDPDAVPVDTPDTEMTPVAPSEDGGEAASE